MLKHIRSHEEIYCNVKLINGEEIIGKCIVVDDDDENYSLMVEWPCEAHIIERETPAGDTVNAFAISKWMSFTKEDFCIIDDDKIISLAPLQEEIKLLYSMFVNKELIKKDPKRKSKKEVSKELGLIDNVEMMRKKLEDLFKSH